MNQTNWWTNYFKMKWKLGSKKERKWKGGEEKEEKGGVREGRETE